MNISAARRRVEGPRADVRMLVVAVVLLGAAMAGTCASALTGGVSAAGVLLAGAVVGGALLVLLLWRLEAFVLGALLVRASLDVTKVRGGLSPSLALGLLAVLAALLVLAQRRAGEGALGRPLAASAWGAGGLLEQAAAVLAFGVGVSLIGAGSRGTAAIEFARLCTALSLLVVLRRTLVDRHAIRRLVIVLLLAAVVPVAMALGQAVGLGAARDIGGFLRVRGTFLHPNPFAMFCTVQLVLAAALLPRLAGRRQVALVVHAGACGLALLGTYARGAWIAALVGLVVVGVLQRNRRLLGALAALVLVIIAVAPSTVERFADLGTSTSPSGVDANSLAWRVRYWTDALELVERNPFTGVGYGMVAAELVEGVPPHNDYLRLLVETGVVGSLGGLIFLGALLVTARRAMRRARSPLERAVAEAYAGCLAAFGVVAATANVLSQVAVVWYLLALAGAAAAVAAGRADLGDVDRDAAHAAVVSTRG